MFQLSACLFFFFLKTNFYEHGGVTSKLFIEINALTKVLGLNNLVAVYLSGCPTWVQLIILFVLRDFIHWNIHRLLHRVPLLWEFHKVHHSAKEMGFATHLRYH